MELNRDQIIKALECWTSEYGCKGCPFIEQGCFDCGHIPIEISQSILSIIKELTEDKEGLNKTVSSLLETIKDIKADTVRKIKTQVHNKAIYPSTKGDVAYISLKAFDALADGLISDKN